jgi:predicted O-methyltransferase YrrM
MNIRKLIPAAALTLAVAIGSMLIGVVADTTWLIVVGAGLLVLGLLLSAIVMAQGARSIVRLLRSTNQYARMSSQRTVAISQSLAKNKSTRRAGRAADSIDPAQQSVEASADVALVVALGATAESAVRFAEASERGRLVVVTDRPEVVARSARHVAVEFIQPSDDPSAGLALALVRVLDLAVEHSAASVLFWPDGSAGVPRHVKLESPEIQVFAGHALRALVQADAELRERLDQSAAHERAVVNSITRHSDQVKRHITNYLDDVYHQGEALARLYKLLDPPIGFPPMRGWAVSPDLALHLVESILSGDATNILETGSGTSTVLMALALERVGTGHVTAIEHHPGYATSTRELLAAYGVEHRATVLDAPIVDIDVEGELLPWYDVASLGLPSEIDLLFVDGPPEATGPQARYPAVPVIGPHLAERATIIMDDGRREAEQQAVARWSQRPGMSSVAQLPVERAALLLRLDRSAAGPIEHSTR